jgi:phenol 2-monooxygenase
MQKERIRTLGDALSDPKSFIKRVTTAKTTVDFLIEILTIHSAPRDKTELFDLPKILRPYSEHDG